MENEVAIRSYTKKELAELYHVSTELLKKWLKNYEKQLKKLGYDKNQKVLTVAQVKFLFQDNILGRP